MRILYVTTISNTLNAFLIPHIKLLKEMGHEVDIACNIVQELKPELIDVVEKVYPVEFQRSIFNRKNIKAFQSIQQILRKGNYGIVHTHTPIASACVRLCAKNIPNLKVIYTAHGFHFYNEAPLLNWLTYYPVEKALSKYTDIIITINQEDYNRATHSLNSKRVVYIPGVGIDTKSFKRIQTTKSKKREELKIPQNAFLLLSIGELNQNKNHEVGLRALARANNRNIHYVICGTGPLEDHLKKLVNDLGLRDQVKLVGYRKDIGEVCKAADVFVFPSYREGLPVSIMEAMSSNLPIICSKIRGNTDLVREGYNGFLHDPADVDGFATSINHFYSHPNELAVFGGRSVELVEKFSNQSVNSQLQLLYAEF
ncbi:glycosyltransferase family 4 protein [Exiguobacterium chiriqhucha]|uniref:glycosyltransferase family 4 protein n=1 Tax=Exiguobacterium chiriqhucha TaxID=1385984 RepID=UPI0007365B11|nr:glycosyltransferase family 4 protein [Exiguobacterium chiriqhucha]